MWWWLAVLACQSGGRDRHEERVPPRVAGPVIYDPPLPSTLLVPLSLPLDDLARILDDELPSRLLNKRGLPLKRRGKVKGEIDIALFRTGDPELVGLGDGRVRLAMPLSVDLTLRKSRRPPIRVWGALQATADVDLGLTEDWRLDPDLDLAYEWIEPPRARVLGLELGVRKIVEKRLGPKLPELADKVEDALRRWPKLHEKMTEVWERLREPQITKGEPPGWFAVRPETVYAGRLTADQTHVRLTAGMRGVAGLGVGEPPELAPVPLPPVSPPPDDRGLHLPVNVGITWEELSELANRRLEERGDEAIVVQGVELALAVAGIEIYPSGDKLAVGVDYESPGRLWSSYGTAWLLAEPDVEHERRRLRLRDFDYAVESSDRTVGVANNELVRDGVRDVVAPYLEFEYGPRVDDALATINERIESIDLPKGAGVVRAHLDDVELRGVSLLDEALLVRTHVTGSAQVALAAPDRSK